MNKNELSKFKKGFKVENKGQLQVRKLFNAYCKQERDGGKVIFTSNSTFDNREEIEQEKFFLNFKKLLTGAFGTKLFNLEFKKGNKGTESQKFLYELVKNDFESGCKELTDRILKEVNYGADILITIILGQSFISQKKTKGEEAEENDNYFNFIMCSVNRIEEGSKELTLDVKSKEVLTQDANMIINMNKPIEGFVFPNIVDGAGDVNEVMYCTSRANLLNRPLINEVLKCNDTLTSKEENEIFKSVLIKAIGEVAPLDTLSSIYTDINSLKKNNDKSIITGKKLASVLEAHGIKNVEESLTGMIENLNKELTIDNLIPTGSKGVKIHNGDVTISIGAESIDHVSQETKNGKRCLVIELDDEVNLDGFRILN